MCVTDDWRLPWEQPGLSTREQKTVRKAYESYENLSFWWEQLREDVRHPLHTEVVHDLKAIRYHATKLFRIFLDLQKARREGGP